MGVFCRYVSEPGATIIREIRRIVVYGTKYRVSEPSARGYCERMRVREPTALWGRAIDPWRFKLWG